MYNKAWCWHFQWTASTFNELLSIDSKSTIERFLPTSDNIRQHILRAYLQCYIWLHYAFLENIDLDPLEYGYRLTEIATLPQSYQLNRQFPATFLSHATTKNAAKSVSANVGYWKFVAASSVNLMQVCDPVKWCYNSIQLNWCVLCI